MSTDGRLEVTDEIDLTPADRAVATWRPRRPTRPVPRPFDRDSCLARLRRVAPDRPGYYVNYDWSQAALDDVQSRLQDGLAFLATVGSTAPFVGLFGTVWGIYHALIAIGVAGQASIDKVAGPVGEALIMTAIGLAVAVPAVLGYNWLLRRNKAILDQLRYFTNDLYAALLGAGAGSRDGSEEPVDSRSVVEFIGRHEEIHDRRKQQRIDRDGALIGRERLAEAALGCK